MEEITIQKLKEYIQGNKVILTAIITAIVTIIALYKWSSTNVIFISSPDNVRLEIFDDLDGPDSTSLFESNFVPQVPKYLVVHITENYRSDLYYDYFHNLFFKEKKWGKMGYHFVLNPSSSIVYLTHVNDDKVLSWDEIAYHTKGYNSISLSIAIVGGLHPGASKSYCRADMTLGQKANLIYLIQKYRRIWPDIKVVGHRDLASKDLNKNGKIDQKEWVKPCPCFDVREWLRENTDIDPL